MSKERTNKQLVVDFLAKSSKGASEKSPRILTIEDLQKEIEDNGGPKLSSTYLKDIVKRATAGLDVTRRGDTIEITGEVYSPGYRPGDTRYGTNPSGLPEKSNSRGGKTRRFGRTRGTL